MILEIDEDEPDKFRRMYIYFATVKQGFVDRCKLTIGLDGCFLKGTIKG